MIEATSWENFFQTKNDKNSYVQIEFKNRYIFPTHYSFRGWNTTGYYSYSYCKLIFLKKNIQYL